MPFDTAESGTFQSIFRALESASRETIGPAQPRLLVIPIFNDAGAVAGGLWGVTLFRWLQLEMLVVPPAMRRQGSGSALVAAAEAEARERDCIGIKVDTLSFQAVSFYERLGFERFGELVDCPPGHRRIFLQKRLS